MQTDLMSIHLPAITNVFSMIIVYQILKKTMLPLCSDSACLQIPLVSRMFEKEINENQIFAYGLCFLRKYLWFNKEDARLHLNLS